MPDGLPPDWRLRLVSMIRRAEPLSGEWFTGGPVCTPLEQIGIYARQYDLRLLDALKVEIPGLVALLRDVPDADGLLRRYLDAHPSRTWTLNRVADGLAAWLETQDVPRPWVEMAWLDRAIQAGFEAADGEPIDVAALATMPRLRLQPHVSLLRLTWSVHEVRAAALTRGEVPPLVEGDFPVVVFRRSLGMRHWVVPLGLWGLLDGLARGLGPAEAIDDVFVSGKADADTLATSIGGWFRDLAERDLVSVVR